MSELTFTAIYEEAEEGGYIAYVAELPGANPQGETLDEARENVWKQCLRGWPARSLH
ncbi:MAG: type II toxin-antitoxin system HicB family antitoxin [Pyrinomonadaceae bacterium]